MTTTLDRTPTSLPPVSVARTSTFARWWGQWRVALRLARRDAWRAKGRSLLVLLIVGLPVAVMAFVDIGARVAEQSQTLQGMALAQLPAGVEGLLYATEGTGASQSTMGMATRAGSGPAPTEAGLLAALPDGSRLIPQSTNSNQMVMKAGVWEIPASPLIADLREPLIAAGWTVLSGRFPTSTSEVALGADEARRLSAEVGAVVTVSGIGSRRSEVVDLSVVGIVDSSRFGGVSVVLPGAVSAQSVEGASSGPNSSGYYVDSPTPMTWSDVRRVNAAGGTVVSRAVVLDPPAFCPLDVICLDDGPPADYVPEPTYQSPTVDQQLAAQAALTSVVALLVVLQIALLAGPAFAVQLRRRQRELGLLGATGGDASVLRRTVLASGVVLGVTASVGAAVLAWVVMWFVLGRDWNVLGGSTPVGTVPTVPWELAGIVGVGILAAVAAALVPAITAGKGEVVDALRGRRPLPKLTSRRPVLGIGLGLGGLAVMAYGVTRLDVAVLAAGILAGQLGLVLVMPWLVVQTGRIGRWLPLAPRMAVRDAGRHRLRTSAAACAIAAAAAAAVGVAGWVGSATYSLSYSELPVPDGVVVANTGYVYGGYDGSSGLGVASPASPSSSASASVAAALVGAVRAADPAARTAVLQDVSSSAPTLDPGVGAGALVCGPELTPALLPDGSPDPAFQAPCSSRGTNGPRPTSASVAVVDPAGVDLVLGPAAPIDEVRAALEAGKAVVLQPGAVKDGEVVLRLLGGYDDTTGMQKTERTFTVPAIEVLTGAVPTDVLVGPAFLARPDVASSLAVGRIDTSVYTVPSVPDAADRPSFQDRVQLELYRGEVAGGLWQGQTVTDPQLITLLIAGFGTALMALLAGLMVTALSLADGKADVATLAAVGAPPRVRRRMAAASAGYVSLIGCIAGAASGGLAGWVLIPLLNGATTWRTPWAMVLVVAVGVPLLTAAVAWLTTRNRIGLTRRLDT